MKNYIYNTSVLGLVGGNSPDLFNNTEPLTYSEDLLTDNDDLTGLLPALHAGLVACQVTED